MTESKTGLNQPHQITPEPPSWLSAATRFGLLGMLLACLSRVTTVDPDLFHEVALIRDAIQVGHLPTVDQFAYTPTVSPVIHHEWGTGAILYLATIASRLHGSGLILVQLMLGYGIGIGAYVCARRRGASEPVIALLSPLAIIMAWIGFSTVRAQFFTLALVVVLQLLLTVDARNRRWWIPLWLAAYVVWLNLHAGFLVGFGLFVLYSLERCVREAIDHRSLVRGLWQTKHVVVCWFVMAALVAANPYGLDYYRYLWRAVPLPRPAITEWSPLWEINAWELLWALVFSQLINLYALRKTGLRMLQGVAMVVVPAILAFRHARHLSIYAVVWMCCAPAWIEHTPLGQKVVRLWQSRPHWVGAFWVLLGVLGVVEACRNQFWTPQIPTSPMTTPYAVPIYPAGAIDYLADNRFEGTLHTPFIVGAYVSWKLHPAVQVSTDGRYEVAFPTRQVEELEAVYRLEPGWEATLNRYPPDAILVPWWSKLGNRLTEKGAQAEWRQIYRDDAFTVLIRSDRHQQLPIVRRIGGNIRGTFP